ncbi:hypothetical protein HDV02_002323 [Globomyces sp. JEL0801]|nr:hypothetical protein HDV02_002323 [Globomyces sp. JEL0801]
MKVVVLGGGISGLAAAFYAKSHAQVTVIAGQNVGGWVQTKLTNGRLLEAGPRSLRPSGESARSMLELVYALGLDKQVLPVPAKSPAALNRFIYSGGSLHNLPANPLKMIIENSPVIKGLVSSVLKEPFQPKSSNVDESIHEFVSRRLGAHIADNLVSAVIHGVYAGDIKKLSIRSTLNVLWNAEQNHGSLSKYALSSMFSKSPLVEPNPDKECQAFVDKMVKGKIYSFSNGMQQLTDTLRDNIVKDGVQIVYRNCHSVANDQHKNSKMDGSSQIKVSLDDGSTLYADHVISTIPSINFAEVIPTAFSALSNDLKSIESVDVAVVNLVYQNSKLEHEGFGFLVPKPEFKNMDILGVVYDSCSFPKQSTSKPNEVKLTVMLGGYVFLEKFGPVQQVSKEKLLQVSVDAVEKALKFKPENLIDSLDRKRTFQILQ